MENNCKNCNRDRQTDKLEQLTDLVMSQIKRIQEMHAKIIVRKRAMTAIGEITKQLQKIDRKNRRRISHTKTTMEAIRRARTQETKYQKTKSKLFL